MSKMININSITQNLCLQLKKIKYPYQIDDILIKSGDPRQYLPIFNYLLLEYSPLVSKSLLEKEYEFYSKNDKDFVKTIIICLINYFGYKPSISCEQFFREGFAESKIGFTIDFIGFIIKEKDKLSKKHKEKKKGSHKEKEKENITNDCINKVEYDEDVSLILIYLSYIIIILRLLIRMKVFLKGII